MYAKCESECKWRMNHNHSSGYDYLNSACYLDGVFGWAVDCPVGSFSSSKLKNKQNSIDNYTEKEIR